MVSGQGKYRSIHRESTEAYTGKVQKHTQGKYRSIHRESTEAYTGKVQKHTVQKLFNYKESIIIDIKG